MNFLLALLGLAILIGAGDALVRGAVNLSLRLGIPALIVSLTVVAFGTSAPELLISVGAALEGLPGIAMGNVVGSNIANVLMVLGVPALISGLVIEGDDERKSFAVMLAASVLFIVVCFFAPIAWPHALILLAALGLILGDQFREALSNHRDLRAQPSEEVEGADPSLAAWKIAAFLIAGLVGLPIGANIFVDAATAIAETFGVSDTVIGLTLVAIGTSLPELATTVAAAFRKQAGVAFGNVIGSNIFNLLAIIGITGLVAPIPVDDTFLRQDLWVMSAAALLLAPFVYLRWNMGRIWGLVFLAVYLVYLFVVVS